MAKSRQQKAVSKERLVEEFKQAKSVVFADYQGLNVAKTNELRKKMREANVSYMVAKKSLFTLAAKEAGFELNAKQFGGMLGAAFGKEDEIAPAKVFGDVAKTSTLKLMGGIFEGNIVDQEKVVTLSKLPSKKELLGMVVGTMYAPVSAFVRALNAIRESLDKGVPAPEPKAEEAAPAAAEAPKAEEAAPAAEPAAEPAPAAEPPAAA